MTRMRYVRLGLQPIDARQIWDIQHNSRLGDCRVSHMATGATLYIINEMSDKGMYGIYDQNNMDDAIAYQATMTQSIILARDLIGMRIN